VALVPPAKWIADPAFLETLLSGLSGHPLLQASTVTALFEQVKTSQVQRSLASSGSGSNAGSASGSASPGNGGNSGNGANSQSGGGTGATAVLSSDAAKLRAARKSIEALEGMLPTDSSGSSPVSAQMRDQLLVAESGDISEGQRASLIAAVQREANKALGDVTLPGSSSITLTARKGQVPLTVLSLGGVHARVELRLSSQRLIFRAFDPPGGHCFSATPTSETCELTLAGQNTTIKVPVETRSSGVFPLDVSLWTPGGGQRLALNRDTVRSTAVSNAGVILIVLAIASLAIWWARDLRHGRRARKLIPPPVFDGAQLPADPAVGDFFDKPPPAYPGKGDSRARPRT
jgi:hypothetical protein